MKPLNQNQTDNHQKEGNRREDKKKTNIKFNSVIFFQVGLVVALVASAWAMNLKIGERINPTNNDNRVTIDEPVFRMPVLEQPKIEIVKTIAKLTPRPVERVISNVIKVVPDDTPLIETKVVAPTSPVVINTPVITTPVVVKPPVVNKTEGINSVEFVPIYPGCESAGTNEARKACMSDKIGRFISRKFDTSVANESSYGNQRIIVQFKIDKHGKAVDIIARAPDKNLQKEAQRVIGKLPTLIPGKMGDEPVGVMYMLPINFQINN